MQHRNNPLRILERGHTWGDYGLLKAYLRLPLPYLVVLFKNYSSLQEAVYKLPSVFTKYHNHLWEKHKAMTSTNFTEKQWTVCGIPCTYFENRLAVCDKVREQTDFAFLGENVEGLIKMGAFLFLHSPQLDGAMRAGISLFKKALESKVTPSFCVSYPNLVADSKAAWDGSDNDLRARVDKATLLLIYAVGSEYIGTGYSGNLLTEILEARRVNKKATIVVSGLTPEEYAKRYGQLPIGSTIGFKDEKITQTLKDLRKALEGI